MPWSPVCHPFLLLLILLNVLPHRVTSAVSNSSCTYTNGMLPRPANFSLYILAMQWPFSVCASTPGPPSLACRSPPATFTVRGLWPTNFAPRQPPHCCASPFSLAPILDIAPALRRLWPDLSPSADDPALWERQWNQHGSCSGLTLRSYFRKVLELSRRYDFLRALNSQGVVASADKQNDFQTVQNALNDATGGFRVRMVCQKAPNGIYLDAVHVCLHRTRFETVHCPQHCSRNDVHCCQPASPILIPYWRHERLPPDANDTWVPAEQTEESDSAFWVGQIAGIFVLGGGLAYWMFKQFCEHPRDVRYPRPNRTDYQLLPGGAR